MSKNWKYAALGEDERLDLIKKGNTDVYNSEKKKNASLKSAKKELGLSTEDVDSWDEIIDNALAMSRSVSKPKITDEDVSAMTGSRAKRATHSVNSDIEYLSDIFDMSKEDAIEDAEKYLEVAAEWLANNGYSKDGETASKTKSDIASLLSRELEKLQSEYRHKTLSAFASAIAKL